MLKGKKITSITLYPLEGTQHDQSMQYKHPLIQLSLCCIKLEGGLGSGEWLLKEKLPTIFKNSKK